MAEETPAAAPVARRPSLLLTQRRGLRFGVALFRSPWSAFAALCLLTGSGWILDAALPAALPGAFESLFDNASLALLFFLANRPRPRFPVKVLGYLALLLAVPGALVSLVDGRLSTTTIVLIYTLIPAATIFFAAQSSESDLLSLLGPALAEVAGAALILPFALPQSAAAWSWLGAIVLSALAAAMAALRLHTLLAGSPLLPVAAQAAAACSLVALPLYLGLRPTIVLLTWPQALLSESVHLAVLAATLLLTVRLLRDLGPIAFSTRCLLIPLVTIVEGYALLHPIASWTLPAGILLIVGGSLLLLRAEYPA